MKQVLFGILVVCMGLFTSCDKCKDSSCDNGSSCDSKTGDCVCVCENGGECSTSDGSCACPTFYTGSTCATELRANYTGEYSGSIQLGTAPSSPRVVEMKTSGTDVTKMEFEMNVSQTGVQMETFIVVLKDGSSNCEIEPTKYTIDGQNQEISGTGTITASTIDFDFNIKISTGLFDINTTGKYTGTK